MLTTEQALDALIIINDECNAGIADRDRHCFVHYVTTEIDIIDWRFGGALGFGGKFRIDCNRAGVPYIDCYIEDETPARLQMIERANVRLAALFLQAENR